MTTIFLEFKRESGNLAAFGSDIQFWYDGRWSAWRRNDAIYSRVEELRSGHRHSAFKEVLFVGFTYAGGRAGAIHSMTDKNPPAWHIDTMKCRARFQFDTGEERCVLPFYHVAPFHKGADGGEWLA